jgi:DNA-binding CsgD family transcriptional regulator
VVVKTLANNFTEQPSLLRVRVDCPYEIVKAGLCELLEKQGMTVVSEHEDVILKDLCFVLPPYPPANSDVPTLALIKGSDLEVQAVVSRGYRGYLTQTSPPTLLARALQVLANGDMWVERKVLAMLFEHEKSLHITHREQEIQQLLGEGLSNQDIASHLGVSVSTVKAHITALLSKFKVKSRLELVARYSHQHKDS